MVRLVISIIGFSRKHKNGVEWFGGVGLSKKEADFEAVQTKRKKGQGTTIVWPALLVIK